MMPVIYCVNAHAFDSLRLGRMPRATARTLCTFLLCRCLHTSPRLITSAVLASPNITGS